MARPTNIFNKSRRQKRKTGNYNAYQQQAAAEYKQALERLLLGSYRKINPTTGAVMEILKPPKTNSA
jgi:hypothetical protein